MAKPDLSHLFYDPSTGIITCTNDDKRGRTLGPVGNPNAQGFLTYTSDGVQYKVHRLAWYLYYGRWPKGKLEHSNGNKSDNRINNLREMKGG